MYTGKISKIKPVVDTTRWREIASTILIVARVVRAVHSIIRLFF